MTDTLKCKNLKTESILVQLSYNPHDTVLLSQTVRCDTLMITNIIRFNYLSNRQIPFGEEAVV